MSTEIELRFPARRFHATPWGSHVNEGQVEWPPSPWRILRALIATGFTRLGWNPHAPPPEARRLIERLAAELPTYELPPATTAHTRHYVEADAKKPLIIDAWAHVESGVLRIAWPLELDDEERAVLTGLVESLGYLGRAESWVDGRLVVSSGGMDARRTCHASASAPGPGYEPVRLLAPVSPAAYSSWRRAAVAPIEAEFAVPEGKKRSVAAQKKLDKALAAYPEDLLAALCVETGDLQRAGWSAAPGSREVVYWRRTDALAAPLTPAPRAVVGDKQPFALLALAALSRSASALPPLARVFPQARLLHRALARLVDPSRGGTPELALALIGRDGAEHARDDHRHAHLLPLDLSDGSRLDHVLVYAPAGLEAQAQAVLRRLRRTYMKGGAGELQVTLVGVGDADVMRRIPRMREVLGDAAGARSWTSATPYVAPRLLKRRGRDSIESLIRAECERRGLPAPSLVAVTRAEALPELRHHVIHDATHEPPMRVRWKVDLGFDRPVPGPVVLGYGAHFGLGRFRVADP